MTAVSFLLLACVGLSLARWEGLAQSCLVNHLVDEREQRSVDIERKRAARPEDERAAIVLRERVVRRVEYSELAGVHGRGDAVRMEDAVPLLRVRGELIVGAICDGNIVSAGHNLDEVPMSSGCRVDGFSVETVGDRVCQGKMEPSYDRELFPELFRLDLLLDQLESGWHQCHFPRYPENRYE